MTLERVPFDPDDEVLLLLDAACAWARDNGYRAITLTTYADVAWNAPFYSARGFVELTELTPELVEIRDWERDVGLDDVGRPVPATVMPTRFIPSWASDSQVSRQLPSTPATAAFPAAGIVVTEMKTPTRVAALFEANDNIPAVPATSAVINENQPG